MEREKHLFFNEKMMIFFWGLFNQIFDLIFIFAGKNLILVSHFVFDQISQMIMMIEF